MAWTRVRWEFQKTSKQRETSRGFLHKRGVYPECWGRGDGQCRSSRRTLDSFPWLLACCRRSRTPLLSLPSEPPIHSMPAPMSRLAPSSSCRGLLRLRLCRHVETALDVPGERECHS